MFGKNAFESVVFRATKMAAVLVFQVTRLVILRARKHHFEIGKEEEKTCK